MKSTKTLFILKNKLGKHIFCRKTLNDSINTHILHVAPPIIKNEYGAKIVGSWYLTLSRLMGYTG